MTKQGTPVHPPSMARALDQFYTSPAVAESLVRSLLGVLGPNARDATWIEPSAGGGAFLDLLPSPRLGMDIAPPPGREDIERRDFLSWTPPAGTGRILSVGNPPFGKNSSLALRFLNHAGAFSDFVAFVLPRTFEKASMMRRVRPSLHLVHQEPVPAGSFLLEGAVRDVPTVFQVWERRIFNRAPVPRTTRHPDFEFVRDPGRADFAVQRVGVNAGRVSVEGLGKAPASHFFIVVRNPDRDVRSALTHIDWTGVRARTAGTPSLAASELVSAYSRYVSDAERRQAGAHPAT